MAIKIETEKIFEHDNEYRKILNITGILEYDVLPETYLLSGKYIYISNKILVPPRIIFHNLIRENKYMIIGEMYSESTFQEMIKYIKECGDRLHMINKENKWKGKETIEI